MNNEGQGEFRCLTSQEIGHAVVIYRKTAGMKQLTLALEAAVDERTIQRVERGEKVNDDSLRRIAKALGMEENSFIGPRYVPTKEEAMAKVEATFSDMLAADAKEFATLQDCATIFGRHGFIVNDQHVTADAADDIAAFRDLLSDWDAIYHLLTFADRVDAHRSVRAAIEKIEGKGYRTRYCVYSTEDQYEIAVIMFVPKTNERLNNLKQFLLPRYFAMLLRKAPGP